MKHIIKSLAVLSVGLTALLGCTAIVSAAAKPNIVVILVDDMGFSDLGCYGSEIPTPNLDAMAAGGLRFTQFYNTGRCCPSRAALMTGLYSHEAGVGAMIDDLGAPGYTGHLNDQCVTIAEVLKGAGYFTAMTGKWHLGQKFGVVPWQRGFERTMTSASGGFYYGDAPGVEVFFNGRKLPGTSPELPKNWYSSDLWTDYGIRFIDEAREAKQPFFLYVAFNAPHFPLQAPAADIAKFRGKYKIGWDKLRDQRFAREKELGVLGTNVVLSPRPDDVKQWDSLSEAEQDRFDNIMAIYAAAVSHMDQCVGKLVAALKERGALDNTLIVFMSDNGGNAESGPNGRLEGKSPGASGSTVFCGKSWATLENTPLRRYKHFNHEGGISTPLIVHWPSQISEKDNGQFRRQPGHLVDIMATCVDVAKATYPTNFNGNTILPMEGRSLVPAFANKPIERDALYWEHEGNAAVRVGDWKLVRFGRKGTWELYDLSKDRSEMNDLAAAQPERAKALAARWDAWADRVHVNPFPETAAKAANPKKAKRAAREENAAKAPSK